MQVISAESTKFFVGLPDAPLQLVRVSYTGCDEPTLVQVSGDGLMGDGLASPGDAMLEVPVAVDDAVPGQRRAARVVAAARVLVADIRVPFPFTFTVAEPGWTTFMISHFHYDAVWSNTQAAYTSEWNEDPPVPIPRIAPISGDSSPKSASK